MGRLLGDSDDFAVRAEFEDAVIAGLIVLFQSQGMLQSPQFSSLNTGR